MGDDMNSNSLTIKINDLLKEFNSKVLNSIRNIVDETSRFLLLMAWLNTRIENWSFGRIIIVGGFAVEFYTGSTYRTLDVDLIVEGKDAMKIVQGFFSKISEKPCRAYLPVFDAISSKGIDIVGFIYDKTKSPVKVNIDNYYAYLEAPEELIVKYLYAWKYWMSEIDRDKVLALIAVLWDKVDKNYVLIRVEEEKVKDKLEEALNLLKMG